MSDYSNSHIVFKVVVQSNSINGHILLHDCTFRDSILVVEQGATVIFEGNTDLERNVIIQNHGKIIKHENRQVDKEVMK